MDAILNAVPGVARYDPMQTLPACEVISGNINISTTIQGRSVEGEVIWNRTVTSGEYFTKDDEKNAARVALIGSKLTKQLFGESNPLGSQIRVGSVFFTVKGVLEEKGTDPHGNDLDMEVIVPITTMMSRLINVDYIASAKLEVDETKMTEITDKITSVLKERHSVNNGETDDFSVITPVQVQEMTMKMRKIFTVYLPLISGVVLILGGFIISILMLMSVSRRVSEIGLRKAVGASSRDIMFQFLSESVLISFVGGLLGLLIGIFGTWAFLSKMGYLFFFPWQSIVFGVLLPVVIGILAGIFPARKAANLDPVKALS
ncbi:MAG: ABC transporter permease [Bacteroidia bacterium]|nr:ABC transporter permease [Bacteroidia bacterium]